MKKSGWMGWVLIGCLGIAAAACGGQQTPTEMMGQILAQKGDCWVETGMPCGARQTINLLTETDTGYLHLADREHPVQETEECVSVRGMVGSFLPVEGDAELLEEVIYALCDMKMDYPLEEGILMVRGYMGKAEQNAWQQEVTQRYQNVGRSAAEARCRVPPAGESDHQLGLAVDVKLTGTLYMGKRDPLLRNAAGQWMARHLADYGFVYSPDFENCEAIHLRYVGKNHARVMDVLGVNVKEYGALLEKERAVTLWQDGTPYACVQCVDDTEKMASIPAGMATEVSRDNNGHFIVYTLLGQNGEMFLDNDADED